MSFSERKDFCLHITVSVFEYGACTCTSEVTVTIVCSGIEPRRKESMKERYDGLKQ